MFFNDVYAYPRLYVYYYSSLDDFVAGLNLWESKLEEIFAEHQGYTMEVRSYMTGKRKFMIEIKINKVR